MPRQRSSTIGKRIATDDNYELTRENNAEFERAVKAAVMVNDAFGKFTNKFGGGNEVFNRLTTELYKVVQSDPVNDRGERTVLAGDQQLLKGFELNGKAQMRGIFNTQLYTASVDRAAGTLSINIAAFQPDQIVFMPKKATHFSLISIGVELDFTTGNFKDSFSASPEILYGDQVQAAITLSTTVPANSTHSLFLAFGIRFHQQVNNKFSHFNDRTYNALSLILIDRPA